MERLQCQKNGSGAEAFQFLGNDSKKGNVDALDQGFTSIQMQELENVEQVWFCNFTFILITLAMKII